jgi:TorA maturation chaperone TorD
VRLSAVQQEFLNNFLLPWLEQFTASVIEDGESPLYQAIAHCTATFVTEDMARLVSLSHV